jgi:hypothetical protein
MGQSRSNPMSTQFRGHYPEEVLTTGQLVYERPSLAWMNEHPTANPRTGETEDGLKPPPEQVDVSVMLTIQRVQPSALLPGKPMEWPRSEPAVLGPLLFLQRNRQTGEFEAVPADMTLADFRRLTPIKGDVAKGIEAPEPDVVAAAEPETKAVEPS